MAPRRHLAHCGILSSQWMKTSSFFSWSALWHERATGGCFSCFSMFPQPGWKSIWLSVFVGDCTRVQPWFDCLLCLLTSSSLSLSPPFRHIATSCHQCSACKCQDQCSSLPSRLVDRSGHLLHFGVVESMIWHGKVLNFTQSKISSI